MVSFGEVLQAWCSFYLRHLTGKGPLCWPAPARPRQAAWPVLHSHGVGPHGSTLKEG